MRIGTVEISHPVALGPMAGVTDLPFRRLCREMGCGLLYTEMVSAKALSYHNKNTEPILETEDGEHPLAVQLFGSEPELLADMAKKLEEGPYDIIDLNMGCPVPKVVNNHEGSALMKDPILAGKVIEAMAKAVKKPVTVKIRRGWDESSVNAVEIARIAQESGAAAVAVHGRTRQQYYSGKADWEIIRQVKEAVKIPVIGNGDITDASSAKKMMEETFEGQPISPRPTYKEVCQMILRHASMQIEYVGEHMGMLQMRKQVAWYTAGYPGSSKLRQEVNQITTYEELKSLLTRFAVSDIIV
jgi:nifR3 family TIM-barrel protein